MSKPLTYLKTVERKFNNCIYSLNKFWHQDRVKIIALGRPIKYIG